MMHFCAMMIIFTKCHQLHVPKQEFPNLWWEAKQTIRRNNQLLVAPLGSQMSVLKFPNNFYSKLDH